MRINRFLAAHGIASRRKSEEYITAGKVKVNGRIITDLSFNVDENRHIIEVDGKTLSTEKAPPIYLMFHKPKGCISSASDEKGRKTIYDYVPEDYKNARLFSIGRLDYNTEGLIILTNDGDLSQKLMHPSSEISKVYIAEVEGTFSTAEASKLSKGVTLDDGYRTAPAKIKILKIAPKTTRVQLIITEGKNKQVHRMFAAIGKTIAFLTRKSFGGINLGGLARGTMRPLTKEEIIRLKKY